jgi:acetyltransferase-like isoleucine patch superfamily enzyme
MTGSGAGVDDADVIGQPVADSPAADGFATPATPPRSRLRWVARAWLVLLGLPKTVLFNFRYLPLRQAVKLPILVSHRVAICDFGGTVTLRGSARPASVLLGFGNVGVYDYRRARSVWQVVGNVTFEPPVRLGHGFKLSVVGQLTFGAGFAAPAECRVSCFDRITFGRGIAMGWETLILDNDFHYMTTEGADERPAREAPIVIGDHVWICARTTILKGVEVADGVVVAAGSIVAGSVNEQNALVGGNPARVIRSGVRWSYT